MKENERSRTGMWSLYKMGGLPPAIRSVFKPDSAQQMALIRQVMRRQRNESGLETGLDELEAVVFDLETTGFDAEGGDEILSFGAVAVRGEQIREAETFYMVVNPNRPIPPAIEELTGITRSDTEGAPDVMTGLRKFFEFVGRRTLIAHSSAHDRRFLNAALWRTSKVRLTHRVLDTMWIAKWLEPQHSDYSLDTLLEAHGIAVERRHHALCDAVATAKLWVKYVHAARSRNLHTLGDLYAYLSRD